MKKSSSTHAGGDHSRDMLTAVLTLIVDKCMHFHPHNPVVRLTYNYFESLEVHRNFKALIITVYPFQVSVRQDMKISSYFEAHLAIAFSLSLDRSAEAGG